MVSTVLGLSALVAQIVVPSALAAPPVALTAPAHSAPSIDTSPLDSPPPPPFQPVPPPEKPAGLDSAPAPMAPPAIEAAPKPEPAVKADTAQPAKPVETNKPAEIAKPVATPVSSSLSGGTPPPPPPALAEGKLPTKCVLPKVPHVRQLRNFCGPACLSMVLGYWGKPQDQQTIGKQVFDTKLQATNGADLLYYSRQIGLSSYSYNGNMEDLKSKLALGIPVIVQQYFSPDDNTYHFRVVIGYNDKERAFVLSDPEESVETKMPYSRFARLWSDFGNWALVVLPKDRDRFSLELNDRNPVYHMDMAAAHFRRLELDKAEAEAQKALRLDPGNPDMVTLVYKITKERKSRTRG